MKTWRFASSSGSEDHTTTLHDDGQLTCSCRGFKSPSRCWHVKQVATDERLNITIAGELFGSDTATPLRVANAHIKSAAVGAGKFISPMLASALPEELDLDDYQDEDHHLEEKYNGHRRILLVHEGGTYQLWARSGKTHRLPLHLEKLVALLAPGTYDGEEYIPNSPHTDVKRKDLLYKHRLVLFDMLKVGFIPAMDKPGDERYELLEEATRHLNCQEDRLFVAPRFPVSRAGLDQIWNRGGEGAIIKRTKARYQSGKRSADWTKFKKEGAAEVTITGFKTGKYGPHSRVVGFDRHGVEVTVKSLNDEWRADFKKDAQRFIGRTMVISYQEKTAPTAKCPTGKYAHPMADHILET